MCFHFLPIPNYPPLYKIDKTSHETFKQYRFARPIQQSYGTGAVRRGMPERDSRVHGYNPHRGRDDAMGIETIQVPTPSLPNSGQDCDDGAISGSWEVN
jgi:hypothetical protein